MQAIQSAATRPAVSQRVLPHDEIAQCARDLWIEYGRPTDRDQAIWFEAEQRLLAATQTPPVNNAVTQPAPGQPTTNPAHTAERHASPAGPSSFSSTSAHARR